MQTKYILQKDYTLIQKFYKLKLSFNIDYMIPTNDSVQLLSRFVEEMDLKDLYMTYSPIRGNQVSPRNMLKIMIYAYMNRIYSSRDTENACRREINFMFLLEGASAPDHATFARFRNLHFAPCSQKILATTSNFLREIGEISGYESEKTIYVCEDCSNCTYKSKCIKGNNCKTPSEERTKKELSQNRF